MTTAPPAGLADRKKERTRLELARAAAQLFAERGYHGTTVNDIVAAVDVSPRTFFRYFPAKEDLILALGESGMDNLLAALAARPGHENQLAAVSAAVVEALAPGWTNRQRMKEFLALMRSTPQLRARWLEQREQDQHRLAAALAKREGVAMTSRHLITAAALSAAIASARDAWADDERSDPARLIRHQLAILSSALLPRDPR